ncbi:MAG: hypothetical protein PVG65_05310 [Candidatus Thorarchaeota archaeon]|jgi:hypothetical protein
MEKRKTKLSLYEILLAKSHTELTENEVNLMHFLAKDPEIQDHLLKKRDSDLINMKIKELEKVAAKNGLVVYNICFRNAGVAIMFYDDKLKQKGNEWQDGLYIDAYHKDIGSAINAEISRLKGE